MEVLPRELILRIIDLIPSSQDLKSLRSVNRRISSLAARKLFETSVVRFRKNSLQKLAAISKDPLLSTYVKEIVYDTYGDVRKYWNTPDVQGASGSQGIIEPPTPPRSDEWHFGIVLDEAT